MTDTTRARLAREKAVSEWRALNSPRLGMRGYLCVLGFLAAGPATSVDVADAFDTGRQRARELLWRMAELGMVHQAGTRRVSRAGPAVAVWAYGAGPVQRQGIESRLLFSELMQLRRLLQAFEEPARPKVVAAELGSNVGLVYELTRIGRELGLMHVSDWEKPDHQGGVPVACWVLGRGTDAPRPKPVGPLAVRRAWGKRQRDKAAAMRIVMALAGTERLAA